MLLFNRIFCRKCRKLVEENATLRDAIKSKQLALLEAQAERDKLADYVTSNGGMTDLNTLRDLIHENAVAHGWWEKERSFAEVVALCHSELSEALEEDRSGGFMEYVVAEKRIETDPENFLGRKPEGVAVEMADCLIRILDWFGHEKLDACAIVARKMEYNKGRPYKHGKEY